MDFVETKAIHASDEANLVIPLPLFKACQSAISSIKDHSQIKFNFSLPVTRRGEDNFLQISVYVGSLQGIYDQA
jgi:hypothetical protein